MGAVDTLQAFKEDVVAQFVVNNSLDFAHGRQKGAIGDLAVRRGFGGEAAVATGPIASQGNSDGLARLESQVAVQQAVGRRFAAKKGPIEVCQQLLRVAEVFFVTLGMADMVAILLFLDDGLG